MNSNNNNAIFIGEYTSDPSSALPPVAVFHPSATRPGAIMRMGLVGLSIIGVVAGGLSFGWVSGTVRNVGMGVLLLACAAIPVLFFRNTRLFATDEHFGVTNSFGEMKLVPRDRLARVEAGEGFRFQAIDGSTLLMVKPGLWEVAQVRQLSSFLKVPFEVEVPGQAA